MKTISLSVKRAYSILLCLLILLSLPAQVVMAGAWEERDVSLTVELLSGSTPVPGVEFDIYKVADMSESVQFELCGSFAGYPVALNGLDSAGWRSAAETLSSYAARDSITPLDTASTNADGEAAFPKSISDLDVGLYLVMGERFVHDGVRYATEPSLICLPNGGENDEWVNDVVIIPKIKAEANVTDISVIKIWNDSNNETYRPAEIEVQLLKDGNVSETIKLSKTNSWKHTWSNLDTAYEWKVVEKTVPQNYTVAITQEGSLFAITNTLSSNVGGDSNDDPKLPQTGTLWWIVPIPMIIGVLFIALSGIAEKIAKKSKSGKSPVSKMCIITGLAAVSLALVLIGYNLSGEITAHSSTALIEKQLTAQINEEKISSVQESVQEAGNTLPHYVSFPKMEMPTVELDGNFYIGTLELPKLGLSLPIIDEWSYPALKIAPCRYVGSAYQDNLVVAAHNYSRHFGQISDLQAGDSVVFTDAVGNVFNYRVGTIEVLSPNAVDEMVYSEWDLTLFTCTYGGQSRIAVRCQRVK